MAFEHGIATFSLLDVEDWSNESEVGTPAFNMASVGKCRVPFSEIVIRFALINSSNRKKLAELEC